MDICISGSTLAGTDQTALERRRTIGPSSAHEYDNVRIHPESELHVQHLRGANPFALTAEDLEAKAWNEEKHGYPCAIIRRMTTLGEEVFSVELVTLKWIMQILYLHERSGRWEWIAYNIVRYEPFILGSGDSHAIAEVERLKRFLRAQPEYESTMVWAKEKLRARKEPWSVQV